MLQLTRSAFVCTESPEGLAHMRRSFEDSHAIRLQGFLHPELLEFVQRAARGATFYDRAHGGIGREQCMRENPMLGMMCLIANDPRLFDTIRRITGCDPIGSFDGRVYLMRPGSDHYDRWHSDMTGDRLIGMSVNLTENEFKGGIFEMRHVASESEEWAVANTGPGDAILFRISDDLRHRVTAVEGEVPRVAFAGWFQSRPDFLELLERLKSGGAEVPGTPGR